jgi:hypothetical protein
MVIFYDGESYITRDQGGLTDPVWQPSLNNHGSKYDNESGSPAI